MNRGQGLNREFSFLWTMWPWDGQQATPPLRHKDGGQERRRASPPETGKPSVYWQSPWKLILINQCTRNSVKTGIYWTIQKFFCILIAAGQERFLMPIAGWERRHGSKACATGWNPIFRRNQWSHIYLPLQPELAFQKTSQHNQTWVTTLPVLSMNPYLSSFLILSLASLIMNLEIWNFLQSAS
jgi:hypothetical protein